MADAVRLVAHGVPRGTSVRLQTAADAVTVAGSGGSRPHRGSRVECDRPSIRTEPEDEPAFPVRSDTVGEVLQFVRDHLRETAVTHIERGAAAHTPVTTRCGSDWMCPGCVHVGERLHIPQRLLHDNAGSPGRQDFERRPPDLGLRSSLEGLRSHVIGQRDRALPRLAGDESGDDVGGVAVERLTGPVVAHGRAWIRVGAASCAPSDPLDRGPPPSLLTQATRR